MSVNAKGPKDSSSTDANAGTEMETEAEKDANRTMIGRNKKPPETIVNC